MPFRSGRRIPDFGEPLDHPLFRGRIHPDFTTPDFIDALLSFLQRGIPLGRILLEGRNRVVAASIEAAPGRSAEVVLKIFRTSGFKKLKTLVTSGKAARAWQGAAACQAAGIPTPEPLAFLERRRHGLVAESLFVSAFVPEAVEIRGLFRDLEPHRLSAMVEALAFFIDAGHTAGIQHRDLSDGNILVRGAGAGNFEFFLIDTNRIRLRPGRPLSLPARARNLVRLGVPAPFRRRFLDAYPSKGRFPALFRLWYCLGKTAYTGLISFRKALRLKRIAKALRIQ